jgi:hypothetical protein
MPATAWLLTMCTSTPVLEVPVSVVEESPRSDGPPTEDVLDPQVASIARSLEAKLSTPNEVIERVVGEELLRFREARVRAFIPILVERAAAHRLVGPSN